MNAGREGSLSGTLTRSPFEVAAANARGAARIAKSANEMINAGFLVMTLTNMNVSI